jgi:hypothetical protein
VTAPPPPDGLGERGRGLWSAILADFTLQAHEMTLLLEACRTVDAVQRLEDIVKREGVLNASPQGLRAHPALVEARQQRMTLARLLAALRIPVEDARGEGRTQRRVGVRGVYGRVS